MTRYPLYRRLGGPQDRSGRLRKISPPPGFDPRTVQPVASRYTVCAIPAQNVTGGWSNFQPSLGLTNASSKIYYRLLARFPPCPFPSVLRLNIMHSVRIKLLPNFEYYNRFSVVFHFTYSFACSLSDFVCYKLMHQILVSFSLTKPPLPTNINYGGGV
jgi:hypothetical protein